MKLPGFIVLVSLTVNGLATARAADATTPVDYTQRNSPYAPAASVTPDKKTPETNTTVQEKRVDKTTVEKKPAAVGDKRAAVDVKEMKEKNVREKDSHKPEKIDQPMSSLDHREAPMSTANDTRKPPMVSKYQDGLTASNSIKTGKLPAMDHATGAKINRFVFRKNEPDNAAAALGGAPVTPAAGDAPVLKK